MNRLQSLIVMAVIGVLTACGGGGGGGSSSGGGGGTVSGPPMSITTTTLPDGIAGRAYSAQLSVTGGIAPYTWSPVTAMPPGLTLSSSGTISGTLQNWGGNLTVQVQDSGVPKQTVTQMLTLNLYSPLSIYTTSVSDGHVNVPYDFVVQSFSVKTWTITAGQLPSGLQLVSPSQTQVEIKGTPNQTGNFTFTLEAQSVSNPPQVASKTFTMAIDDNPAILTSQTLDVVRGKAYSDTLQAVNGIPPYHWAALQALPPGIFLDSSTGVISGTYTNYVTQNVSNVNFQVTDSSSPARSSTRIVLMSLVEPLSLSGLQQYATLNEPYYDSVRANGGRQPFTWSLAAGSLPPGLVLNPSGLVTGTPTQLGDFNFTLKLTDSTNAPQIATSDYKISVRPPTLTTSYSLPNRLPQGVPFSGVVAAQGGTPPYTWQLNTGTLPAGLQLNSSTGEVSGTPTALGYNSFSVKVTDSGSPAQIASQPFGITVAAPLGRNNSVQKATPITTNPISASISPYSDPVDTANPDVDYYKLIVNNATLVEIQTHAKQSFTDNPLDTVLEVVDANGARLNYCSADVSQGGPAYNSPCLNDDVQKGVVQDSRLWLSMPGSAGTQSTVYVKVFDWRGDARPDMFYGLEISGAVYQLRITSTLPTGGINGTSFSQQLTASGGTGTQSWSVMNGNLPTGLTLSTGGLLSGTPTVSGTYAFTVRAMDQGSPAQAASATYTFVVADTVTIITPGTFPDACVNTPYTFAPQASGGIPPYSWGLNSLWWGQVFLDLSTGVFSGTPSMPATYTGDLRVTDAVGAFAHQTISVTIKSSCP